MTNTTNDLDTRSLWLHEVVFKGRPGAVERDGLLEAAYMCLRHGFPAVVVVGSKRMRATFNDLHAKDLLEAFCEVEPEA